VFLAQKCLIGPNFTQTNQSSSFLFSSFTLVVPPTSTSSASSLFHLSSLVFYFSARLTIQKKEGIR